MISQSKVTNNAINQWIINKSRESGGAGGGAAVQVPQHPHSHPHHGQGGVAMGPGARKGATQPAGHFPGNASTLAQGASYMGVSELNASQQNARQGATVGGHSQYTNNSRQLNATQQHTDSHLSAPHPSEALPHIALATSPNPRAKKTKGSYKGPVTRPGQSATFDQVAKASHGNTQSYGGAGSQQRQGYPHKAHQNPPTAVSVDGIHQNSKTQLRSGQATQQALTQQVSAPARLIVDNVLFV